MSVQVNLRKNEPVDKALRRLKKKLDREDIIRTARARKSFTKPSAIKREKKKVMRFSDWLRHKRENS